jgi:hypothetical protein
VTWPASIEKKSPKVEKIVVRGSEFFFNETIRAPIRLGSKFLEHQKSKSIHYLVSNDTY